MVFERGVCLILDIDKLFLLVCKIREGGEREEAD